MKKIGIILLIIFLGVILSGCLFEKNTNQNVNKATKSQKTLEYICNLPKVPSDYVKDCENFRKGVNSGLIK